MSDALAPAPNQEAIRRELERRGMLPAPAPGPQTRPFVPESSLVNELVRRGMVPAPPKPQTHPLYDEALGAASSTAGIPKDDQERRAAHVQARESSLPLRLIDLLLRGQYAFANSLLALKHGDPHVWDDFARGITGKQKGSTYEIFKELGLDKYHVPIHRLPVIGKSVSNVLGGDPQTAQLLGFLGDVAIDPLTYVGFGGETRLGKLATAYTSQRNKLIREGVIKAGEAVPLNELGDMAGAVERALAEGKTLELGRGFREQIARRQRHLLTIETPWKRPTLVKAGDVPALKALAGESSGLLNIPVGVSFMHIGTMRIKNLPGERVYTPNGFVYRFFTGGPGFKIGGGAAAGALAGATAAEPGERLKGAAKGAAIGAAAGLAVTGVGKEAGARLAAAVREIPVAKLPILEPFMPFARDIPFVSHVPVPHLVERGVVESIGAVGDWFRGERKVASGFAIAKGFNTGPVVQTLGKLFVPYWRPIGADPVTWKAAVDELRIFRDSIEAGKQDVYRKLEMRALVDNPTTGLLKKMFPFLDENGIFLPLFRSQMSLEDRQLLFRAIEAPQRILDRTGINRAGEIIYRALRTAEPEAIKKAVQAGDFSVGLAQRHLKDGVRTFEEALKIGNDDLARLDQGLRPLRKDLKGLSPAHARQVLEEERPLMEQGLRSYREGLDSVSGGPGPSGPGGGPTSPSRPPEPPPRPTPPPTEAPGPLSPGPPSQEALPWSPEQGTLPLGPGEAPKPLSRAEQAAALNKAREILAEARPELRPVGPPPTIDPAVELRPGMTAEHALGAREKMVGDLVDIDARLKRARELVANPPKSWGGKELQQNIEGLLHERGQVVRSIEAVDTELLRASERAAAHVEGRKALEAEVQALSKEPALGQKAVEVLQGARDERIAVESALRGALRRGDDARAADLQKMLDELDHESAAQWAIRQGGEDPARQADRLRGIMGEAKQTRLVEAQRVRADESVQTAVDDAKTRIDSLQHELAAREASYKLWLSRGGAGKKMSASSASLRMEQDILGKQSAIVEELASQIGDGPALTEAARMGVEDRYLSPRLQMEKAKAAREAGVPTLADELAPKVNMMPEELSTYARTMDKASFKTMLGAEADLPPGSWEQLRRESISDDLSGRKIWLEATGHTEQSVVDHVVVKLLDFEDDLNRSGIAGTFGDYDVHVTGPHITGSANQSEPIHALITYTGDMDPQIAEGRAMVRDYMQTVGGSGPADGMPVYPAELSFHRLGPDETAEQVRAAMLRTEAPRTEDLQFPTQTDHQPVLVEGKPDPDVSRSLEIDMGEPDSPQPIAAAGIPQVEASVEHVVDAAKVFHRSPHHVDLHTPAGQWRAAVLEERFANAQREIMDWYRKYEGKIGSADLEQIRALDRRLEEYNPLGAEIRMSPAEANRRLNGSPIHRAPASDSSPYPRIQKTGASVIRDEMIPEPIRAMQRGFPEKRFGALEDAKDYLGTEVRIYRGRELQVRAYDNVDKMLEAEGKEVGDLGLNHIEYVKEQNVVEWTDPAGTVHQVDMLWDHPEGTKPRKVFLSEGSYNGFPTFSEFREDFFRRASKASELEHYANLRRVDKLMRGLEPDELSKEERMAVARAAADYNRGLKFGDAANLREGTEAGDEKLVKRLNPEWKKGKRQKGVEKYIIVKGRSRRSVAKIGEFSSAAKSEEPGLIGAVLPSQKSLADAKRELRKKLNDWMRQYEVIREAKDGTRQALVVTTKDMGLDFPKGLPSRVVGSFSAQYPIGAVVDIDGRIGKIKGYGVEGGTPESAERLVQFQDGTSATVDLDGLRLADIEAASRRGESVIDWMIQMAKDQGGAIDSDFLGQLFSRMIRRSKRVRREWAAEMVDDIIRFDKKRFKEFDRRRAEMVDWLDAMAGSEESRNLLPSFINFYAPHVRLEDLKGGWFYGRNRIQQLKEFYQYRRGIEGIVYDINRSLEAVGGDPIFSEDALLALGVRGLRHENQIRTYDWHQSVLGRWARKVDAVHAKDWEETIGLMKELDYPQASIDRAEEIAKRLEELTGFGTIQEAAQKGWDILQKSPKDIPPAELEIAREIRALKEEYQNITPRIGVYMPHGSLKFFQTEAVSGGVLSRATLNPQTPAEEELASAVRDAIAMMSKIKVKEGEQLVALPLSKFHTVVGVSKHVDAYIMPAEMATAINTQLRDFVQADRDVYPLLRMFDGAQNWWKAWTLFLFPVYFNRNIIGNIWNSWLAGMSDPKFLGMAARLQMKEDPEFVSAALGKSYSKEQLTHWAQEHGVVNEGWVAADIQQGIKDRFGTRTPPIPLWGRDRNFLLWYGRKWGTATENNARIALFLDGLDRGLSPFDASIRVKKYLFDYQELTSFEKNYARRGAPFYTWTRKNVPLQLQMLLTRPAKFSIAAKAIGAVQAGVPAPVDETLLGDWMKQSLPIRLRQNPDGTYQYWLLGSWLPAADLFKLFDPAGTAGGMLTPFAKALYEWNSGQSLYFKGPIEKYPGETDLFLGMRLRKKYINALKNIRLLNMWDRAFFPSTHSPESMLGLPESFWVNWFVGRSYPVDFWKQKNVRYWQLQNELKENNEALRREMRKQIDWSRTGERPFNEPGALERWMVKEGLTKDTMSLIHRRKEILGDLMKLQALPIAPSQAPSTPSGKQETERAPK